jgi:hypothetical protein
MLYIKKTMLHLIKTSLKTTFNQRLERFTTLGGWAAPV